MGYVKAACSTFTYKVNFSIPAINLIIGTVNHSPGIPSSIKHYFIQASTECQLWALKRMKLVASNLRELAEESRFYYWQLAWCIFFISDCFLWCWYKLLGLSFLFFHFLCSLALYSNTKSLFPWLLVESRRSTTWHWGPYWHPPSHPPLVSVLPSWWPYPIPGLSPFLGLLSKLLVHVSYCRWTSYLVPCQILKPSIIQNVNCQSCPVLSPSVISRTVDSSRLHAHT